MSNIKITYIDDPASNQVLLKIEVPNTFISDECEPYGSPELCDLITQEQGFGIIEDAVLMAMHLKRRSKP